MRTPLEIDMLAELKTCRELFYTYGESSPGADQSFWFDHGDRIGCLIAIASAPGLIKALPRGDLWAGYISTSSGKPLKALTDGFGAVCLYATPLEALEAACAALNGP